MWSGLRWWRSTGNARRLLLCGAALAVLLALSARSDVSAHVERVFRAEPRTLAHQLADWRIQRALLPEGAGAGAGEWLIEEESGAAAPAAWRYTVRVQCGARCVARVWLEALEYGDGEHELRVRHRTCTRLPLLPWPESCEEWQSAARVAAAVGGGARYGEAATARCWRWDGAGCEARLRLALRARLLRVAALLGEAV